MKITIEELQEYLFDHYKNGGIDQSLFMKLVEEIGEVAEVLNKKAGRKSVGQEDLQTQLGNELADVVHYTIAIAALNGIDMNDIIIGHILLNIIFECLQQLGFAAAAYTGDHLDIRCTHDIDELF